jgi:hypothetical protein
MTVEAVTLEQPADPEPAHRETGARWAPSMEFVNNLRNNLVQRYQVRNDDYNVLINMWHGNHFLQFDRKDNMDSAGKPILRVSDMGAEAMPQTINILKVFADAYKRMLAALPDIGLDTPGGKFESTIEGQKQAETYVHRMIRACYGIWEASRMEINQVDASWWLPICGAFGMLALPDFKKNHATIQYVAPYDIYGVGKMGDPFALSRCIVTADEDMYKIDAEYKGYIDAYESVIARTTNSSGEYPQEAVNRGRTVRHTIYLDDQWFVRIIGDKMVGRVKHDLGFCPALIAPFIRLPGWVNRGHSAIEQLVPMQLSIDYAITLFEAGLKDSLYPTTWVKEPQDIPPNWARGRGQLITIGANGDIGEVGGNTSALKTVRDHFALMREAMEANSGVSRSAMDGRLSGGGPTTGRGIEKSQGAYLAGVDEIQTVLGDCMSTILKMAMDETADHDLWEETPDDTVEFNGIHDDSPVYEKFTRAELKGMPKPEMLFSPMAHLGLHERVNIALQLFNTTPPGLSWEAMVKLHALVRNIPELRLQIESDMAWRNKITADAAKAQQPQQPPGPAGTGTPETAGAAIDAGATNQDTLRRAGAAEQVPPAGAPAGPTPPAAADASTGTASAAPAASAGSGDLAAKMKGIMAQPPPDPTGKPTSGLGDSTDQQIRNELSTLSLKDAVYLKGMHVEATIRDLKKVKTALEHHKGVTVTVYGKNGPKAKDATLIAGTLKT